MRYTRTAYVKVIGATVFFLALILAGTFVHGDYGDPTDNANNYVQPPRTVAGAAVETAESVGVTALITATIVGWAALTGRH